MVFVAEGSSLRLRFPQGLLRISDDGSVEALPVETELLLDTWQFWLRIAMEQEEIARTARDDLILAVENDDKEAKMLALRGELQAAMTSIVAAAFTFDAFYSGITHRIPAFPEQAAWKKNRRPRAVRVAETIRRAFKISRRDPGELVKTMKELFKFRNWAVHPPSEFTKPVFHPVLKVGTDWRYAAFSASNCGKTTDTALTILTHCFDNPKPHLPEIEKWCEFGRSVTAPLKEEWTSRYSPPTS